MWVALTQAQSHESSAGSVKIRYNYTPNLWLQLMHSRWAGSLVRSHENISGLGVCLWGEEDVRKVKQLPCTFIFPLDIPDHLLFSFPLMFPGNPLHACFSSSPHGMSHFFHLVRLFCYIIPTYWTHCTLCNPRRWKSPLQPILFSSSAISESFWDQLLLQFQARLTWEEISSV